MKSLILFLASFLIIGESQALSCNDKTLDLSAPGGVLYPLRTTDQNGLGICHIEQLHKLIKAKLPGHPDLSRIQLAIAAKGSSLLLSETLKERAVRWMDGEKVGGTYIDGGNSCKAFTAIKGKAICPASSDQFELITKESPENQGKILGSLSLYFDERKKILYSNECSPELLNKRTEDIKNLEKLGVDAFQILKILKGKLLNRENFFSSAFRCYSESYTIPTLFDCRTLDLVQLARKSKSQEAHIEKVAALIDGKLKNQTPVGISTCTRFFRNPQAQTLDFEKQNFKCGDKTAKDYVKNEGSHAVTIIGKRCREGQQEYLIQNSWGSGCYYAKKYECTGKGGFWAPAEVVIKNIRNINTID